MQYLHWVSTAPKTFWQTNDFAASGWKSTKLKDDQFEKQDYVQETLPIESDNRDSTCCVTQDKSRDTCYQRAWRHLIGHRPHQVYQVSLMRNQIYNSGSDFHAASRWRKKEYGSVSLQKVNLKTKLIHNISTAKVRVRTWETKMEILKCLSVFHSITLSLPLADKSCVKFPHRN